MHESADLKSREENLNYKRESLLKNFSKYFNEINVDKYLGNPALIASRVYGNRMGNGSEESKEGYLYRGRGFMQLTGKNNYELFGIFLGDKSLFIKNPSLVSEIKYSVLSAIWFWNSRKLTSFANSDANSKLIDITYKDEVYKNINKAVADISKLVNGGYHGIVDRNNRFLKYSTF
jgi:putative chitinase